MRFEVNLGLLAECRAALVNRGDLFWVVGGAGSGKTTVCRALAARYGLTYLDMDARIYGTFHSRFTAVRHPANSAWAAAPNGLQWLLEMSWEEFDGFNRAALPEYLDLLIRELGDVAGAAGGILIDGGLCNPGLLAQVIQPGRIVCLRGPERSSAEVWEQPGERESMKEAVYRLPSRESGWRRFLEFNERITTTLLRECQENGIAVCTRTEATSVDDLTREVANVLGMSVRQDGSP